MLLLSTEQVTSQISMCAWGHVHAHSLYFTRTDGHNEPFIHSYLHSAGLSRLQSNIYYTSWCFVGSDREVTLILWALNYTLVICNPICKKESPLPKFVVTCRVLFI